MPLSMYQASVPVLLRGLHVLSNLLDKGVDHAKQAGQDPAAFVGARLAPDMLPLSGQVQRASDTAKFVVERLAGQQAPRFPDEETTFEQLQDRIARTISFLETASADSFTGSETREVTLRAGQNETVFAGDAYLLSFALPNFFFHVTTAYDILRHLGVPIGKRDYLGAFDSKR